MDKVINISIEARMTSSRLPGKVLMPINGIPALEFMINRIKNSKQINKIIVATTTNKEDDSIVDWCLKNNFDYFRGSENNVYERVLQTHQYFKSDIIIELTGDCPFLTNEVIDESLEYYLKNDFDYISNDLELSYPIGIAVQIYSLNILENISCDRDLTEEDKEHVTPYLYTSNRYKISNIKAPKQLTMPELSITLDTKEDLQLLNKIAEHFNSNYFTVAEIIEFMKQNKNLLEINNMIKRKGLTTNV